MFEMSCFGIVWSQLEGVLLSLHELVYQQFKFKVMFAVFLDNFSAFSNKTVAPLNQCVCLKADNLVPGPQDFVVVAGSNRGFAIIIFMLLILNVRRLLSY